MNQSKNNGNNLPQKYVSFKRRTRNYRKRRPAITFILPKVNAFSASGMTAGFIPITGASTGISRLPTIRLIYFLLKSVRHILIMRFRYGMCMCIGRSMNFIIEFNYTSKKTALIALKFLRNYVIEYLHQDLHKNNYR